MKKECDVSVSISISLNVACDKEAEVLLKTGWEESAPRCNEKVWYTRPCECKVRMNCYEKQAEERTPGAVSRSCHNFPPSCAVISFRCDATMHQH